jgi:hypothetical protein
MATDTDAAIGGINIDGQAIPLNFSFHKAK